MCPFSYFLKYGLKIKEKRTFKIQSLDTGNFMHEVIDEFFKEEINIKQISENEIKEIVSKIIDKKLSENKNRIFTMTPKFAMLTNRLKKVIIETMKYIVYQIKCSSFKVIGTEVEFREGGKYPPIEIKLDNGKKVEIEGKIDRIDLCEGEKRKIC